MTSMLQTSAPLTASEFYDEAMRVGAVICHEQRMFTTDDLWAALPETSADPRMLGSVMQSLRGDGLCRPTTGYVPSTRKECHGRPVRVWQSTTTARL